MFDGSGLDDAGQPFEASFGERDQRALERRARKAVPRRPRYAGTGHEALLSDLHAKQLGAIVVEGDQQHVVGLHFATQLDGVRDGARARLVALLVVQQEAWIARHGAVELGIDEQAHGMIAELHHVHPSQRAAALDLHAVVARGGPLELKGGGAEVTAVEIDRAVALRGTAHREVTDTHAPKQVVGFGQHADDVGGMRGLVGYQVGDQATTASGLLKREVALAGLQRGAHQRQTGVEDVARSRRLAIE